MPPRGVKSATRKRQYEHIKKERVRTRCLEQDRRADRRRDTNKTRRNKGETKG